MREQHLPVSAGATLAPSELRRIEVSASSTGGFEGHPWLAGAEEARHFRAADVQRDNDIQQAARERRKHRR